jgi:cyclic beta-1,2-glucan synthetase
MRLRRTPAAAGGPGPRASAGWMYRFILESLLGLRLDADKLHVSPCLPADWNSSQVHYRYRQTIYHITVMQTSAANGEPRLTVDGALLPGQPLPLVDDRREHLVEVRIPPAQG